MRGGSIIPTKPTKVKFDSSSESSTFFIASLILKESRTYYKTFEDELNRHMATDFSIMLPIDGKGKPDWNYMEEYVEYIKNKSQSRIDLFNIA